MNYSMIITYISDKQSHKLTPLHNLIISYILVIFFNIFVA
jgi:hypothetical protein